MADTFDPRKTIVVATGNAHKLTEIQAILAEALPDYNFVSIKEFGDFEDPEEIGTTFYENAVIKAEDALVKTGALAAIADDSGLMVDALDGAPGVYSARYAGEHGNDKANNEKLKNELKDVPEGNRQARFVSCVVLEWHDGELLAGEGTCEGEIGFEEKGENGFGYDPLFLPRDTPGRTMAELSSEEKNSLSHRFHALNKLAAQL